MCLRNHYFLPLLNSHFLHIFLLAELFLPFQNKGNASSVFSHLPASCLAAEGQTLSFLSLSPHCVFHLPTLSVIRVKKSSWKRKSNFGSLRPVICLSLRSPYWRSITHSEDPGKGRCIIYTEVYYLLWYLWWNEFASHRLSGHKHLTQAWKMAFNTILLQDWGGYAICAFLTFAAPRDRASSAVSRGGSWVPLPHLCSIYPPAPGMWHHRFFKIRIHNLLTHFYIPCVWHRVWLRVDCQQTYIETKWMESQVRMFSFENHDPINLRGKIKEILIITWDHLFILTLILSSIYSFVSQKQTQNSCVQGAVLGAMWAKTARCCFYLQGP